MANGDDNIKPEIRALIARGSVTLEEWKSLRMNSWEFELVVPVLDDEALIYLGEHMLKNMSFSEARPFASYNDAVPGLLVPELLKRLRAKLEEDARRDSEAWGTAFERDRD